MQPGFLTYDEVNRVMFTEEEKRAKHRGREAKPPNPGSDEALDLGCRCAVLDNNHGRSAPWPPDGWWITVGCPVHPVAPVSILSSRSIDASLYPRRLP
jgi:hypothetical protein